MNYLEKLSSDPRVIVRRSGNPDSEGRAVVYWMQRAQRGIDNPALDLAIEVANELKKPLAVFFGLHPGYPNANLRHYSFLVEGLAETAKRIEQRGACFVFRPYPAHDLIHFCEEVKASIVIGDENPLRKPHSWRHSAASKLRVPLWTVDADVVVPTKLFIKEEYAARTFRPKIQPLIEVFLQPPRNPHARYKWPESDKPASKPIDTAKILASLSLDHNAQPVTYFKGGTEEALRRLRLFTKKRLARYDNDRNLAHVDGTSELSAYLHFGHISPITIALAVKEADAPQSAKDAYLEELIVRRELAINFIARNQNYDRLGGCPDWALKTLAGGGPRSYIYSESQFEYAETHDVLWNAAQMEMVTTGSMHGYLRMYWAKKILEWSETPEEAFQIAVRLNDRYQLDGRDPNSYTGIAWAIGGKHDRPWAPRRPVFGLIRYMSASGMQRKFNVKAYIDRIKRLS